jgi:Leucine-rich repeat (LRR) protein
MLKTVFLIILLLFITFLPISSLSQDYVGDTLAVRAILDSNGLDTIPVSEDIIDSSEGRIVNLYLISKQLSTIPSEIGVLTSLVDLWLYGNSLTTLPPQIENLDNLMLLNLPENTLSHLPLEIGNLPNLSVLELNNNNLTELPSEIGTLNNLVVLKLNNNNLTNLPSSIGGLYSLRHLNLCENNLTSLPDSIVNLTPRDTVDVSYNRLARINLSDPVVAWLNNYDPDWEQTQNTPIISNLNKTIPQQYLILQNSQGCSIYYHLNAARKIKLDILDLQGKLLATLVNSFKHAGDYTVKWNSNQYNSGVYCFRLSTGSRSIIKKVVLIK